jgi:hypothetical protein
MSTGVEHECSTVILTNYTTRNLIRVITPIQSTRAYWSLTDEIIRSYIYTLGLTNDGLLVGPTLCSYQIIETYRLDHYESPKGNDSVTISLHSFTNVSGTQSPFLHSFIPLLCHVTLSLLSFARKCSIDVFVSTGKLQFLSSRLGTFELVTTFCTWVTVHSPNKQTAFQCEIMDVVSI